MPKVFFVEKCIGVTQITHGNIQYLKFTQNALDFNKIQNTKCIKCNFNATGCILITFHYWLLCLNLESFDVQVCKIDETLPVTR